jgi:hypothetical protein
MNKKTTKKEIRLPSVLYSQDGAMFQVIWHKFRNGEYQFSSYRLTKADIERRYR